MNCTCLPECNSVDYTIVDREIEILRDLERERRLKVMTYVNKSRIKRDLLFSIDYLIGMCVQHLLNAVEYKVIANIR